MKQYERELAAAQRAAAAAGDLINQRAGTIAEHDIRKKGLNDLVTEVDEAAQDLIIRTLQETFPDARFLAEEGVAYSDDVREGYLWIIDPIDGTTNFTRGVPPFAVSIALRIDDRMTVGVVLDVARGELFSAVRDGGMYVDGRRHLVSATERVADSLITTGFPYREIEHVDLYLSVLGDLMRRARGIRRPGSAAIDLAYVAAGRFDAFYETGLQPWDVAAGLLLVQEAGGRVTDFEGGGDPLFDQQLLATNGLVHDEMLEALESMRPMRRGESYRTE